MTPPAASLELRHGAVSVSGASDRSSSDAVMKLYAGKVIGWDDSRPGERRRSNAVPDVLLKEYVNPDRGPTEVTRGSHYRALWKCAACGYEWRAMVNNRTIHAQGCPACSGRVASSTNNFVAWCEKNGELGKKLLDEYVDPDRKPTEAMRASH